MSIEMTILDTIYIGLIILYIIIFHLAEFSVKVLSSKYALPNRVLSLRYFDDK